MPVPQSQKTSTEPHQNHSRTSVSAQTRQLCAVLPRSTHPPTRFQCFTGIGTAFSTSYDHTPRHHVKMEQNDAAARIGQNFSDRGMLFSIEPLSTQYIFFYIFQKYIISVVSTFNMKLVAKKTSILELYCYRTSAKSSAILIRIKNPLALTNSAATRACTKKCFI